MKRSYLKPSKKPLKRKGKSETAKLKERIQKLLTATVRIRDGGCIFRNYPETGACSGYTAADHIISRIRNISYGEPRNVICACNRHHIFWKPQNSIEYNRIVREYVGEKTWQWIEYTLSDRKLYTFGVYEWANVELALRQELKEISNGND